LRSPRALERKRRLSKDDLASGVCTENLDPDVVVMESTKDGVDLMLPVR
jgi:hypothetical protein